MLEQDTNDFVRSFMQVTDVHKSISLPRRTTYLRQGASRRVVREKFTNFTQLPPQRQPCYHLPVGVVFITVGCGQQHLYSFFFDSTCMSYISTYIYITWRQTDRQTHTHSDPHPHPPTPPPVCQQIHSSSCWMRQPAGSTSMKMTSQRCHTNSNIEYS